MAFRQHGVMTQNTTSGTYSFYMSFPLYDSLKKCLRNDGDITWFSLQLLGSVI